MKRVFSHPTCVQKRFVFALLFSGLVDTLGSLVSAQVEQLPNFSERMMKYLHFETLPRSTQLLIITAVNHYDNFEFSSCLDTLKALLEESEYKHRRPLRAWTQQWLAMSYFALDSIASAKKHVNESWQEDSRSWNIDYDFRIPRDLHQMYFEIWRNFYEDFNRKRQSLRLGIGTISRLDYGYRFGFYEILVGIGAPIKVSIHESIEQSNFEFKRFLIYARMQGIQRSIDWLSTGLYIEASFLLNEDLENNQLGFTPGLSFGAVVAYTKKSGWQFGGSFEFARMTFQKDSKVIPFSQTNSLAGYPISYANFEIYLRKWF